MGLGDVNGGLALRETARVKRSWSPDHGGKAVVVGLARGEILSMKGVPDQGSSGPVTGAGVNLVLVGRVNFSEVTRGGKLADDRDVKGSIVSEQRLGGQCPILSRTIR